MPNPHIVRTARRKLPRTQGPYVDNCPANLTGESRPDCANCSEIERCIPGTDCYDEHPRLSKIYPDCANCSELQRKTCSQKADYVVYGCCYAMELFGLGGFVALIFGIGPVAIGCGVGFAAIVAHIVRANHHLNRGAKPVQALGCCAILRNERS